MKFRIHYEVEGVEDTYIIAGNSIKKVKEANEIEMKKRNITIIDNNVWSENLIDTSITN